MRCVHHTAVSVTVVYCVQSTAVSKLCIVYNILLCQVVLCTVCKTCGVRYMLYCAVSVVILCKVLLCWYSYVHCTYCVQSTAASDPYVYVLCAISKEMCQVTGTVKCSVCKYCMLCQVQMCIVCIVLLCQVQMCIKCKY